MRTKAVAQQSRRERREKLLPRQGGHRQKIQGEYIKRIKEKEI